MRVKHLIYLYLFIYIYHYIYVFYSNTATIPYVCTNLSIFGYWLSLSQNQTYTVVRCNRFFFLIQIFLNVCINIILSTYNIFVLGGIINFDIVFQPLK